MALVNMLASFTKHKKLSELLYSPSVSCISGYLVVYFHFLPYTVTLSSYRVYHVFFLKTKFRVEYDIIKLKYLNYSKVI